MLWGIEWQHWAGAGALVALALLFRLALHLIWLWRLGPKHDFDLDNPETRRTGVYRTAEDLEMAGGVVVPAGFAVATVDGRVGAADMEMTFYGPDGEKKITSVCPTVQEITFPAFRCRRCGKVLGLNRRQMDGLPPEQARGCRPA